EITPLVTQIVSCLDNDGEITVMASGGTGTYTYTISPMPTTIALAANVFSGVPSGTYTVTITDTTTLCEKDVEVTLGAATPVTFTTTPTHVTCIGGNNGMITVNLPASNDNPIYTYEITAPIIRPAQTTSVFSGLVAGTYTVLVTSGRGCTWSEDVIIDQPDPVAGTGVVTDYLTCGVGNVTQPALVTITGSGG